jgi:hypothetical protein
MTVKRVEIVKMLEERLRQIAPELSAQQAQSVIELVEPTGAQLFFTTMNGRAVQRLIRNYLVETNQFPKVEQVSPGRTTKIQAAPPGWRLPVNQREKVQFAKNVLEVLAIQEQAQLDKIDSDIAHVNAAIESLRNVLGSAVNDPLDDLEDARDRLQTQRRTLLETKPWILRAIPNGCVPVNGQPQKKARRVQDEDDDSDEFDDDDM